MVGIDLVYIPEFKKQLKLGRDILLQKAFTKEEVANQKADHLAGIWAAKEAIMKALGNTDVTLEDIDIKYTPSGQPYTKINGRVLEISIAHHGDYAIAIAQGR
jgi:phosphopantetheine--protein transferase-like protein